MNSIKRIVKVTIEKEIEIELTPSMFGGMTEEEFIAQWRKSLWDIDSIDDVVTHAASLAADGGIGGLYDGLGLINNHDSTYPRVPDVKVRIIEENSDAEILK